ncbi:WAS/WASL-interacting protein family member 2-like [Apodemus sylvaticus]|uniref:WAS/WASL-interacting protein family member 2-like n=1 Tax=Apodemus sylvaticus TaxID=10129 RepID=UPI0022427BD1|nr:WAS/WASL-interacting protein family member 2-like [Apodemus sylvaticus]
MSPTLPPAPSSRLCRMRPPLPTRETAPSSRVQRAPALRPPSPTRGKKKNSSSSSLRARPGEAPGWRAGEEGRVKGARGHGSGHAPQSPPPAFPQPVPPRLRNPAGTRTQRSRRQPGSAAAGPPPGTRSGFPLLPPPPDLPTWSPPVRAGELSEKRPSLSPAPEPPGAGDAATAQPPRHARKKPGAEARPRRERPPPPRACGPALPAPPPRPPGSRAKQRAGGRRPRGGGASLTGPAAPSGGRRELRLSAGETRAPPPGASLGPRFLPFPTPALGALPRAPINSSTVLPVSPPGVYRTHGSLPSPGARPPPPRLPGAARPLSSPLRRLPSRL